MKYGEQKKIAQSVGVTSSQIGYVLRGKSRPSPELAARLEQVTGISRLAWLYPDEYPNPLINQKRSHEKNEGK